MSSCLTLKTLNCYFKKKEFWTWQAYSAVWKHKWFLLACNCEPLNLLWSNFMIIKVYNRCKYINIKIKLYFQYGLSDRIPNSEINIQKLYAWLIKKLDFSLGQYLISISNHTVYLILWGDRLGRRFWRKKYVYLQIKYV